MENNILKFINDKKTDDDQGTSKQVKIIGAWIAKLASYLPHSVEFREKDENFRREFFYDMIYALIDENYPKEAWSSDSRRFVMKRCEFFPSLKELCNLLNEYTMPIVATYREKQQKEMAHKIIPISAPNLSYFEASLLNRFHEHEENGFEKLAEERETNPDEARKSTLSLINQLAPKVYELLTENNK